MALALDATAVSTDQTASPLTWTHTNTGQPVLVVGVASSATVATSQCTAVTYAGVAMTQVGTSNPKTAGTAFLETTLWVLFSPALGANTVSCTMSGGTTPHFGGVSASYTRAAPPSADANNKVTGGAANGDVTLSVTTVADNCWVCAIGINAATTGPTIAADQTSRQTLTLASTVPSILRFEDTNADQTPAGAKTVGFTTGSTAAPQGSAISALSIAPASITPNLNNFLFVKVGDGMSTTEKIR